MIQREDIMKIANLAKLEIKSHEVTFYIDEMQKILDFAENINVDENEEIISKTETLDFNNMREDLVSESFENSEILINADGTEESFFKLRKKA